MLAGLKKRTGQIITGISFRILFFNALLLFICVSSFLTVNRYEHEMLKIVEIDLNEQTRFIASNLAWKESLAEKDVGYHLRSLPWTTRNKILVADAKGKTLYTTKPEQWDTGPNPSIIRKHLLYCLAETMITPFISTPAPVSKQMQLNAQKLEAEGQVALTGTPTTLQIRAYEPGVPVVIISTFPIARKSEVRGFVQVTRSANEILIAVYQTRLNVLRIIFVSIIAAILLNILLARTIILPIKRLTEAANLFQKRDDQENRRVFESTTKYGEIATLSKSVHHLTDRLNRDIVQNRNFVDDLVHEMKNPLAAIRSAGEAAVDAEGEERDRFLSMIPVDISRMENLLSQVKDLSHIKSSGEETEPAKVDIIALTIRYIDYLKQLHSHSVQLERSNSSEAFYRIDEERFIQLLDNLVQNAVDFSPLEEPVRICIGKRNRSVLIEIKDQGEGIPPENREKVFQRFYSLRKDDQQKKHSGLGLAIVKSIVENQNGRIQINDNPPKGTCISIELPLKQDDA